MAGSRVSLWEGEVEVVGMIGGEGVYETMIACSVEAQYLG